MQRSNTPARKLTRLVIVLAVVLLTLPFTESCTRRGVFPHSTGTQVDLAQKNYRVVKSNAMGSSSGFRLLGIIPITSPSYTKAVTRLSNDAGVLEGKATALVNVTQERSTLYLILFSIPKISVRADIIEFTE